MSKRIRDYVKYSLSELERYTTTPGSCVNKVNTPIHLNFPPYGLANFRETLQQIIAQKKIGFYDGQLKGIVLDVRHIKVLGDIGAMRFDDPAIHLDIQADCFVFQPQVGAIVKGMVKHISARQIGVIIYRVFSVSIRLAGRIPENIELNTEIEFRIKRFDLQNVMPFIEGELVQTVEESKKKVKIAFNSDDEAVDGGWQPKTTSKEPRDNESSGYNSDGRIATKSPDLFDDENMVGDSDIEPEQKIKQEKLSQSGSKPVESDSDSSSARRKHKKHNSSTLETTELSFIEPSVKIKSEKSSPQKKSKSRKTSLTSDSESSISQRTRNRKNSTTIDPDIGSESSEKKSTQPTLNDTTKLILERMKVENDVSTDQEKRKRKRTTSSESPSNPAKKPKTTKTIFPDIVNTEIYLDSDIEMTTTPTQKTSSKKSRKSKDVSKSEEIDRSESLDSSNLTEKAKKKKSKTKEKESSN